MNSDVNYDVEYVVFDRWANHKPRTLFAELVKGDGSQEIAAFRVSRNGDLRRLATYETEIHHVELKDVTGDGSPELLVTSNLGNRSAEVDILQWTGRRFDKIGEVSDHAAFIDVDGDGIPESVEAVDTGSNECDAPGIRTYVSKLKNGEFEEEDLPNLLSVDEITKQTAARETQRFEWLLPDDVSTKCAVRVRPNGITSIRIRIRELDDDDEGDTIALHTGTQRIELPSRCTEVDVTVTGPRGATAVLLLESR